MSAPTRSPGGVRDAVVAELGLDDDRIDDDTDLRAVEGVGAGRILQIVGALERARSVDVDDARLYRLRTVADIERALRDATPTEQPARSTKPEKPTRELDGWMRALEDLVPTPERFTAYTVRREEALGLLRVDDATLDRLVANGLRAGEDAAGEEAFDEYDLYNVAMWSGSGRSVPEVAVRYNLRFAASDPATWVAPERWRLRNFATCPERGRCPEPWHHAELRPEDTGGRLLELAHDVGRDGPKPSGTVAGRPALAMLDACVETRGRFSPVRSPEVRDAFHTILDELRDGTLRFQAPPAGLRTDPDLAREVGVGNCVSTALMLEETLSAAGYRCRTVKGYFIAVGPEDHGWVEVFEDGVWKMLDPVFALLAEWPLGRERAAAFTEFCVGSVPNRVVPLDCRADQEAVRHHHGSVPFPEVPTTIVTRSVTGGST